MGLQISFDTETVAPGELAALAALIAVLRGEKPTTVRVGDVEVSGDATFVEKFLADGPVMPEVAGRQPTLGNATLPVTAPANTTGTTPPPPVASQPGISAPTPDVPDRDSAGVPWDGRIHSTPAKLTEGAGIWRKRRGVDDEVYRKTTAELLDAVEARGGYTQRMTDEFTEEQQKIEDAVTNAEQAFGAVPPPPPAGLVGNVPPAPAPVVTASPEADASAAYSPADWGKMTQRMGNSGAIYDQINATTELITAGRFKRWQDTAPAKQPEGTDMLAHYELCARIADAVCGED